jgi:hypothetical protein
MGTKHIDKSHAQVVQTLYVTVFGVSTILWHIATSDTMFTPNSVMVTPNEVEKTSL